MVRTLMKPGSAEAYVKAHDEWTEGDHLWRENPGQAPDGTVFFPKEKVLIKGDGW